MVEHYLAKVDTRVRFPSPAPELRANPDYDQGYFFIQSVQKQVQNQKENATFAAFSMGLRYIW